MREAMINIRLLLFFFTATVFSISSIIAQSRVSPPIKKPQRKKNSAVLYAQDVRVVLGDNRVIRGKILFRAPKKIIVRHFKKGISYSKAVRIEDISFIQIKKWKSRFIKKNKAGEIFQFEVAESVLRLKDGSLLVKSGRLFPFLRQFPVSNANGRVFLFTYWIDLLRSNGSWYTGMPVLNGRLRNMCYRDVVKKIEFSPGD